LTDIVRNEDYGVNYSIAESEKSAFPVAICASKVRVWHRLEDFSIMIREIRRNEVLTHRAHLKQRLLVAGGMNFVFGNLNCVSIVVVSDEREPLSWR
jgi:hypothetical protein